MISVKYPNELTLNGIEEIDFIEVYKENETVYDEYTVSEFLCIYSYDGELIPRDTLVDAFSLSFDVSSDVQPGVLSVEPTADSILMGIDGDYTFGSLEFAQITVNPKLAEKITVSGADVVTGVTSYSAIVYPDYTTDKSVIWSVSNTEYATISSDGILVPLKNGEVTVIATAKDGGGAIGTKTVNISLAAIIDTLKSDVGYWVTDFTPGIREYTLIVDEDTTTLSLTSTYSYGTLKVNGTTMLNGRARSVILSNDSTTVLTLARTNVDGCDDSEYTINVIKSNDALVTDILKTETGYSFDVLFNKSKIQTTASGELIAIFYDADGSIMNICSVDADIGKESFQFEAESDEAESVKLMFWDSVAGLRPLCASSLIDFK